MPSGRNIQRPSWLLGCSGAVLLAIIVVYFSLSLSVEAAEEIAAVARQRMPGQLNAEVKVQLTTRHGFHSDVQIYPSRNRILDLHGERNR